MLAVRSDNGALRITQAYMGLLTRGVLAPKIVTVCQTAEVSRTTFYNNFEDLEDLEDRFLQFFYATSPVAEAAAFPDFFALRSYYAGIIQLMKAQGAFFSRLFQDHELLKHRMRWFDIVEAPLLRVFGPTGSSIAPGAWSLHLDLAVGVLRRLWEVSLSTPEGDDETVVTLAMEFLWGAKERLKKVALDPGRTLHEEMTPELRDRYERAALS